jgi:hypothetical protein
MQAEIKNYLQGLNKTWQPLKEQAVKYLDQESSILKDGTIQIFRRPWIAQFNYGLIFYPPAQNEYFQLFEQSTKQIVPSFYKAILLQMNGCFIYDFRLFGLPPSLYSKGVLNRSQLQPFDLGAANTDWIKEYIVDKDFFHFGGRAYSLDENIGYFLDKSNNILSIRKNGKQLRQWASFQDFLAEEIPTAEKMMIEERNS